MKNILRNASAHTQTVFDAAFSPFRGGNGALGLAFLPLVLGVTTAAFAGFVATETGAALLGEIRRRGRLHAPNPESPSLRGIPTTAELKADCEVSPRTLHVRLRLGSRLADLEPTLDSGNHYAESPTGAKRIKSRGRGMRGYIADNRINVSYSTLMRYRRLALRLRQLLQLDARLPLEWILPSEAPDRNLPADLQVPYATARRRLSRLFHKHLNFDRLRKHVDTKLGIPELLSVRRATGKHKGQSAVPGGYGVGATPARVESTKRAFARFLEEKDLSPGLADHRDRFVRWLAETAGT